MPGRTSHRNCLAGAIPAEHVAMWPGGTVGGAAGRVAGQVGQAHLVGRLGEPLDIPVAVWPTLEREDGLEPRVCHDLFQIRRGEVSARRRVAARAGGGRLARSQGWDLPDEILSHISPGHSDGINFSGVINVDVEAEPAKPDTSGRRPLRPARLRRLGMTSRAAPSASFGLWRWPTRRVRVHESAAPASKAADPQPSG
ncbi:hypothetical protein ACQP2T_38550 [Nonomuraea sp. CA-143628]|uniref:hypothetical protein n=1 Tax=Nonomuraea sp. CA-143628 TaxID=3239997 RepID=UPI003D8FD4F1